MIAKIGPVYLEIFGEIRQFFGRVVLSQSFHRMKAFWVQMIDQDLFFDISRDVAMATEFLKKMANSALLWLWHSETEWNIAMVPQCAH